MFTPEIFEAQMFCVWLNLPHCAVSAAIIGDNNLKILIGLKA